MHMYVTYACAKNINGIGYTASCLESATAGVSSPVYFRPPRYFENVCELDIMCEPPVYAQITMPRK